jgi:hypothetical protein
MDRVLDVSGVVTIEIFVTVAGGDFNIGLEQFVTLQRFLPTRNSQHHFSLVLIVKGAHLWWVTQANFF